MRRIIYLLIALCVASGLRAQVTFKGQIPTQKVYNLNDIYDSTYGIQLFDKYNAILGGDSVRKSPEGYDCSGWVEDHYANGALLHKGFYADGQLTIYTNYYPGGQVERTFKDVTERKAEMKKYFPDGKIRSEVVYFNGSAISYHDYYDNGNPSYVEEYDKKHERLLQRASYYQDGNPQFIFAPVPDTKKPVRYSHKEYYDGGTALKEEYEMIYSDDALDYVKDGEDKVYDKKGNITSDIIYVDGQENKTIK